MDMDDLYTAKDPVTILDDGSFIGVDSKISKRFFKGKGFLKVYAPWCGHCQAKVNCINRLAKIMPEHGVTVYVINAEDNPVFQRHFKDRVRGFPTFLEVSDKGKIGDQMTTKSGDPVYSVPDIIASLCGNDDKICKYSKQFADCS